MDVVCKIWRSPLQGHNGGIVTERFLWYGR
jgi:hypothetical protein